MRSTQIGRAGEIGGANSPCRLDEPGAADDEPHRPFYTDKLAEQTARGRHRQLRFTPVQSGV